MNTNDRIQNATKQALEEMDYILETRSARDFIEIVGDMGGDVITRRFYDDGTITAR